MVYNLGNQLLEATFLKVLALGLSDCQKHQLRTYHVFFLGAKFTNERNTEPFKDSKKTYMTYIYIYIYKSTCASSYVSRCPFGLPKLFVSEEIYTDIKPCGSSSQVFGWNHTYFKSPSSFRVWPNGQSWIHLHVFVFQYNTSI